MIIEYHRPSTMDEALKLISRKTPRTLPIGGGTTLAGSGGDGPVAVVDVQDLGLDRITDEGGKLSLGAACKLQSLVDSDNVLLAVKDVVLKETSSNLRNMASLAGALMSADGRSPLATMMLALNARLVWAITKQVVDLSELYKNGSGTAPHGLVVSIEFAKPVWCGYAFSARTPGDRPVVCVAAALWADDTLRMALGGHGSSPVVAYAGPASGAVVETAQKAYSQAGDDWASAEYRSETAAILAARLVSEAQQANG